MNTVTNQVIANGTSNHFGRWLAGTILLTPLVVILISTLSFRTGLFSPEGTSNRGHLILPPIPLADIALAENSLKASGKWQLIFLDSGQCSQACQQRMLLVKQVHLALGKYQSRVQKVALLQTQAHNPLFLKQGYQVHQLQVEGGSQSFQALNPVTNNLVLVADPLGNVMMSYSLEHTGKDMLKDLKKLLKLSRIG